MSVIAAALRELMAAGLDGEALACAIERIEDAMPPPMTARQARNRRYYENTKRLNSSETSELDVPSPPSFSPSTPTPITTPPSSSLRSESVESDWPKDHFAQFWAAYPRKVGKKAAARRLDSVRRAGEIGWAALLAAIARIDRKDPQFIPHPSTWLNEGRYLDGIATGPPPAAEPVWMKPPPGAVSYLDKMRTNGNGATLGTEIRNDAGLGKSGPDHTAELFLQGGSPLRRA